MKSQDVYRIHAYDLVTFVQEIEKAVKLGYEVDLHGIDNYPRMLGYQFLMNLLKDSTPAEEVKSEVVQTPTMEVEVFTAVGENGPELEGTAIGTLEPEQVEKDLKALAEVAEPKKPGRKARGQ